MIIVTGGGGFIGSVLVGYLNSIGRSDVVVVDDMPDHTQFFNLNNKNFSLASTAESSLLMGMNPGMIDAVLHMGAISNTLEKDWEKLYKQNVLATRQWANVCKEMQIPFIFASSAAVYGNGDGPLNQYAFSKHVSEMELSDMACCLRFFNVYGPNEYHKGRMASTIMHWYNQSRQGAIKVFENSDQYRRDFIYVEDVCKAVYWCMQNYRPGVYDLGTGQSESFQHIADLVAGTTGSRIEYIPMPSDLKAQYQTDTKADLASLTAIGYDVTMRSADEGVKQYLGYLEKHSYY